MGHTLHRDLSALRMDALLILDISLLWLGQHLQSCCRVSPSVGVLNAQKDNENTRSLNHSGFSSFQYLHLPFSPKRRHPQRGLLPSPRYGVLGQPKRRPSLAHLVQQVLQRDDFRGHHSSEAHDCVQDVLMTMEIAAWSMEGSNRFFLVF